MSVFFLKNAFDMRHEQERFFIEQRQRGGQDGRAGVVAAGGCGALVEAWRFAQEDETRFHIANALVKLGWREEGSASAVSKRQRCA